MTDPKIAIVGGGRAGIAAAFYWTRLRRSCASCRPAEWTLDEKVAECRINCQLRPPA